MKKNVTTLIAVLFVFCFTGIGQEHKEGDTLYFTTEEKDKSFAVILESLSSETMKSFNARVGTEFSHRSNFISLAYYIPKKHYFELELGAGVGAMGTYFFHTKTEMKMMSQKIEGAGIIEYRGNLPIVKEKNFGLRYGVGFYAANSYSIIENFIEDRRISYSRIPLTIGISRFNIRHAKYRIFSDGKSSSLLSGQTLFAMHLDAVIVPAVFANVNEPYEVVDVANDTLLTENQISQDEFDEDKSFVDHPFGVHLGLQGILGLGSRGNLGFSYRLGGVYFPGLGGRQAKLTATGGIGLVFYFDGLTL